MARRGARTARRRTLLIILAVAMLAAACSGDDSASDPEDEPDPQIDANNGAKLASTGPLSVRLSQGQALTQQTEPDPPVRGTPLDTAAVDAIFDLLPEWTEPDDDRRDFNRPAQTLPPPLTGDTVDAPFPADADDPPPDVLSGPLEVLRFQPDGDVDIAPFVSVTFNQPMVPLATLAQLDAQDIPVTITPDLAGRWQWIGTKTLRFEFESDLIDRLPMATTYTVEIPAGTTSETGGELADTVSWRFETPSVEVDWLTPDHDSLPLEPVFLAVFDQRVDPDAVLDVMTLTADGQERPIRLATDNEIDGDEQLREIVSAQLDDRWLAFRAVDAFEPDTAIRITVGPEIPSAEGPNTSAGSQTFEARTYAPLGVVDQSCRSGDGCQPGRSLSVRFNNELDVDVFDPSMVEIEPELPGVFVFARFDSIEIRGATRGRTTYEVTLAGGITDRFGQTLGDEEGVTFVVGPARTQLGQFDGPLITLDPLADNPTIPVTTTNHDEFRVRIFDVDPVTDWDEFEVYFQDHRWNPERVLPDWTEVANTTIDTDGEDDQLTETGIDLSAALDGGPGHLIVLVEPTGQLLNLSENDDRFWDNRPAVVWVQSTNIGLDVFGDNEEIVAWTTDLATGEPLSDVEVHLLGTQVSGTSNAEGLATVTRPPVGSGGRHVTATVRDDVAFLPTGGLQESPRRDSTLAHVFDDRGIYRPEETVHVKGWIRQLRSSDAQLALFDTGTELGYQATDWFGNEIANGTVAVNSLGGFDLEIDIPAGANLGQAWINFTLRTDGIDTGFGHSFQIQEFRRPEFEVTARAESPGPYFVDEPATVAVDAAYFSGGALADAPVEWRVTTRTAQYSPPNWSDFTFGIWTPWWFDDFAFGGGAGFSDDGGFFPGTPAEVEEFSGTTDASGSHFLQMDFDGDGEGQPTTVSAQATVVDVNRQAWSSSTDLLVHPGELYVGLRSTRTFVRQGEPLTIEAIVTDIDGNAVAGRSLTVEAARLEWRYVDREWTEVAVETQSCSVTSGTEPVECTFDTEHGGQYTISADAVDDRGRTSHSELTRWVSGGTRVPARDVEQEEATLIPDKAEYEPGDVAEILVESPFSPAEGLLTVSRKGFVSTERFRIDDFTAVLDVPIEDRHIPGLHVQVDLVGVTERTADDGTPLPDIADRPAYALGRLQLDVPPISRTLTVTAEPADPTLEPGTDTRVDVTVVDADGDPVAGAELAVVVVDEAVLALTGYQLQDPLAAFYGPIGSGVWSQYGRESIVLTNPEELIRALEEGEYLAFDASPQSASADSGGDDAADGFALESDELAGGAQYRAQGGADGDPIDVRTNFDALAVFDPEVTTAADGSATIAVPLPDSLTRYRVMVVAVDGADRFGSGESNITARLPLMVRPSPPRFLNFGDTFELPVVIQNQTSQDLEVDVAVQTANLELTGLVGQRVTVPANDRIEVRFPAAAESAGTARFRVAAVSGDHADAATLSLPVYTPATTEAFATYGVVDDGAVIQPLLAPDGVFPQFGGLEVNTSSTALQALTDAVLYLHDYRFLSSDGLASRILAVAALRDVLDAFDAEGLPEPTVLEANVKSDIEGLLQLQNGDGGFGYWVRGRQSNPFNSIHGMHALVIARDSGYTVSDEPFQRGMQYLRDIENRIPATYRQRTKDTLSAYALHVRMLAGDRDQAKAERLYDRAGDDLGLDAVAWIWPVLDNAADKTEILRLFRNQATETAGAATFTTNYGEDAYLILHSDRRTDGIILDALIREAPDSDLIPKVVAGLLGNQTRGRWNNAQENSFILLALDNYFDTFESVTPDFVARIWLGDLYAGEHEYRGRTTDRGVTEVPMAELIAEGDTDLIVDKDGAGRLYYRLGLRYAPDDLDLDPLDRGFVVSRTYEAVDADGDVWRDDAGVWHVKAGADVRVRLTMVADSRRTHVALVDPLPAGLEAQNPALAVTPELPPDDPELFDSYSLSYRWWQWFEHQNLRDDRAEAFTSLLWAGTYDYTYVARATTPGTFVVPPTKAEEIYAPETFGRSSSDVLVVEEEG